MGTLTLTYFCDCCKWFPLSNCTWFVCTGLSKGLRSKGSNWFSGRCGHIDNWREGSRFLSLRHGLKSNDVALFKAFPLPAGAVRITTNISESDLPIKDENRAIGIRTEAMCGMIEGIWNFMTKDNVKALMSMGERSLEHGFQRGRVQPPC